MGVPSWKRASLRRLNTTQLRLVLSQGGQGGAPGEDGSFSNKEFGGSDGNGADGRDGETEKSM